MLKSFANLITLSPWIKLFIAERKSCRVLQTAKEHTDNDIMSSKSLRSLNSSIHFSTFCHCISHAASIHMHHHCNDHLQPLLPLPSRPSSHTEARFTRESVSENFSLASDGFENGTVKVRPNGKIECDGWSEMYLFSIQRHHRLVYQPAAWLTIQAGGRNTTIIKLASTMLALDR